MNRANCCCCYFLVQVKDIFSMVVVCIITAVGVSPVEIKESCTINHDITASVVWMCELCDEQMHRRYCCYASHKEFARGSQLSSSLTSHSILAHASEYIPHNYHIFLCIHISMQGYRSNLGPPTSALLLYPLLSQYPL